MHPTPPRYQSDLKRREVLRFGLGLSLFATPFLAVVASINVLLNPSGLFTSRAELSAQADSLTTGKFVINQGEIDERLFQRIWIEQRHNHPSLAILGSSRTMQLSPAHFGDSAGVNHSVSGATLEDIFALIETLARQGQLPPKIIWGVDPWMFNPNNGNHYFSTIAEAYEDLCDSLRIAAPHTSLPRKWIGDFYPRLRASLSFSLFQSSLRNALVAAWRNEPRPGAWFTGNAPDLRFDTRFPDGTYLFPPVMLHRNRIAVRADAEKWAKGPSIYPLDGFKSWDSAYAEHFTRLLQWLINRHVQVTLFLPPFHPNAWTILLGQPQGPLLFQTEDWVRCQAADLHLPVLGSWDARRLGLAGTDFLDATHLRREAFPKALKAVGFLRPESCGSAPKTNGLSAEST